MDSVPFKDLAGLLCPARSGKRVMALLRAYCDASFTEVPWQKGITAIGGYIGTADEWLNVEPLWAEHKKIWGLSEFGVSNILAGRTAVGHTNAEVCVRSFGKIIGQSRLEGISAAINDKDWESTYKSARFPTKYHSCASLLFHVIDQHVSQEFPGDTVAIVLDTDRVPDEALAALVKEWKAESRVISSITFSDRFRCPLLECADLCAGTERNAQVAGGWAKVLREHQWYSVTHVHRHRGAVWSLEEQKKAEEEKERREARKA